ncbi:RNase adapter RapZ [Tropicibacter naphthalenivorans]|uniref:GlmZ(SRNA)-inactivating NTPase n=1 Tax=Tropicibacter naphthalenivorans TaxID=441103 RepID=A0A0N7LZY7_9RHOB|nr:RNase adapter RapZ [Tropicibacter naphthalenivorans]CUH78977.1 glmZ(sRNA)-inactivating NTPase [Tropicibacter naphthalenivorans]SMD04039.1 UPF0042 nucleotide-binding protein [Tropicibacter naphthalenivorans]
MTQDLRTSQHVVLVTGPAGAGRSTAINALEDFGFEAIDNIPLSLIPRLIEGGAVTRPLALGIDTRNRDFSAAGVTELRDMLRQRPDLTVDLTYLDASPDVLARRYSETRRRHPLAPLDTPADGIARELALLEDLRAHADILIDTSALTVHDLRAEMEGWFGEQVAQGVAISVQSFSYKRGLPQGLDMAFDCRFLRNPHWEPDLRAFTGQNPDVADYIAQDARFAPFLEKVADLLLFMLPGVVQEGKAHFAIGFGCTGGKHRSVCMAESVTAALAQEGWRVSIRHRELERRGAAALSGPQVGKESQ